MATKLKSQTHAPTEPILSHSAMVDAIATCGHLETIIMVGDMGSAKTDTLKELEKRTGMRGVLMDCTTKVDVGDMLMPQFVKDSHGNSIAFDMVPNVEFGLHLKEDIVLMVDEVGKNRGLMPALTRLFQERRLGNHFLTPKSILYAATNLSIEGVGDILPPLLRNRVTVIRKAKPTNTEWINWAGPNNINPILIAAAYEFPDFFATFTDVDKPEENLYIYDPRDQSRTAFVTARSLAKCSPYFDNRAVLGDASVLQLVAGKVGFKAAHDIMTFVSLDDALPTYEHVVANPEKVKVPEAVGAKIMMAIKLMQRVEQADYAAVHDYIERMPMEIQGLFFNQIMKHSAKQDWVGRHSKFAAYIRKNFHMFTS